MNQKTQTIERALRTLGNRHNKTWQSVADEIHGMLMLALELRLMSRDLTEIRLAATSLSFEEAGGRL